MLVNQTSRKLPAFHLRCNFIDHRVDSILRSFTRQSGFSHLLTECIVSVLDTLYHKDHFPSPDNVRSITIFLDHMDGVAYTTGSSIDQDHKEIHLSVSYFTNPALLKDQKRADEELKGVLVHELVHCFQYNAKGTAPGGFIEGIADYVRYHAKLSPPHWEARPGNKWDDGYQHTAFFLLWIDERYPRATTTMNQACNDRKWSDDVFKDVTGVSLTDLWERYCSKNKD